MVTKKQILMVIALVALVSCLSAPVSAAWASPVFRGNVSNGSFVWAYSYYGGSMVADDAECAANYPTKPLAGPGQWFCAQIGSPMDGGLDDVCVQDILNPPFAADGGKWYLNNETATYDRIYKMRLCSAAPRNSNNYATHVIEGWYNLTTTNATVPLPNVTPTPEPTPLPGYVRNTFKTVDFANGYTIINSDIQLKDTHLVLWRNSTSDADGMYYIDTLPYTAIDAYAQATGYESSYLGLSARTTDQTFYISLMSSGSASPGNTTYTFQAKNAVSLLPVSGASITATWGGVQHAGTTNGAGSWIAIIPNNTVMQVTASKNGYEGQSASLNTGATSTGSHVFYLSQTSYYTFAPTPTGPTGTPTAVPYSGGGSGYTTAQGQAIMDLLANNGYQLVYLCILVTIISLLMMVGGKGKK
jgi:hypothetical protein